MYYTYVCMYKYSVYTYVYTDVVLVFCCMYTNLLDLLPFDNPRSFDTPRSAATRSRCGTDRGSIPPAREGGKEHQVREVRR